RDGQRAEARWLKSPSGESLAQVFELRGEGGRRIQIHVERFASLADQNTNMDGGCLRKILGPACASRPAQHLRQSHLARKINFGLRRHGFKVFDAQIKDYLHVGYKIARAGGSSVGSVAPAVEVGERGGGQ